MFFNLSRFVVSLVCQRSNFVLPLPLPLLSVAVLRSRGEISCKWRSVVTPQDLCSRCRPVISLPLCVYFFVAFATHELLVSVHHSLSYILAIFLVFFQLMAKHAIDYNVFGGPQNFGKWMDVHSAPSCPTEVIKRSTSMVCLGLFLMSRK